MSLDRSLKAANSLIRHRNVLTRAERLVRLSEEEKWNESKPVLGLPKVANRKQAVGGKEEKAEAAEGATPAAAPAGGAKAPAGAAKGAAAPAAGGKGAAAAPAAKAAGGGAAPAAKGKK